MVGFDRDFGGLDRDPNAGTGDKAKGPRGLLGDLGGERKWTAGLQSGSIAEVLDEVDRGLPGVAGTAVRFPAV